MVNKALLQLPKSIVSFRLILATIILSLMGSFFMSQAVSGWSDNMLNSAALDIGRLSCSGVPTGDSEIRRYLQAIPNNATPSQIGIPSSRISNLGLDSSRSLRDQYMNEGATDIFQHCDVNSAVIQHGMTLIDGSDSNEITDFRSQLRLAVNPHREAWINDVCDTEDAPLLTCRDDASKKIDDMITACSSALSSSSAATIPSINNVGDLERCAGESNAFQAIQEQRECEQDGGTFEDGACVGGDDDSPATCVIEHGLGWIICPVMNTLAAINDGAWWALERFLVSPTMTRDEGGAYSVWAMMRNIANVLFVLFLLVIVYSQITSVGISNYGIKKLLPKLIVGAILVNTSWWIVAGAVDLSNVLGSSLYSINGSLVSISSAPAEGSGDGGTPNWQYAVVGLLMGVGGIALVMANLAVALPLLLGALFFVGGLVIALTFRNALVLMLAVLAPIAFVAYLLPGTNGFFRTWYTLFKAVLLIYPAAALAMGLSNVAASITWQKAQSDGDYIMMFVAAAMPAMGIVVALLVAKTMGSVMSKFGVTNPLGGVTGAAKNAAKNYGKRQDNINSTARVTGKGNVLRRGVGAMRFSKTRSKGRAIDGAAERNLRMADARYIADEVEGGKESLLHKATRGRLGTDNKMASALSGGMGEEGKYAAIGSAVETQAKFEAEEVTAQNAIIKSLNLTNEQQAMLATGREVTYTDRNNNTRTLGGNDDKNIALRMAAQQSIAKSGDAELINHVIDNKMRSLDANQSNDSKELANFADALASSSNKPAYIQAGDIEDIRNRGKTIANINNPSVTRVAGNNLSSGNLIETALTQNVYSPERLATTGRQEANVVVNHAENSMAAGSTGRVRLRDNAEAVFNDPELTLKVGKQREALTRATYL